MSDLAARADALRALHRPGAPLVLRNAWDAASAKALVADAPALATTSVGVAEALGFAAKVKGFLESAKARERHRAGAEHSKEQGVERAEMARKVRAGDCRVRIAGLGVDECERVVTECEVRT